MDKEIIKEIAIQLKEIGTSLKDLGAEGFTTYAEWFYKAQIAEAIINGLTFIGSSIVLYFLLKGATRVLRKHKENDDNLWDIGAIGLFILSGIVGIFLIASFFCGIASICRIIAPEYYALMQLLGK